MQTRPLGLPFDERQMPARGQVERARRWSVSGGPLFAANAAKVAGPDDSRRWLALVPAVRRGTRLQP